MNTASETETPSAFVRWAAHRSTLVIVMLAPLSITASLALGMTATATAVDLTAKAAAVVLLGLNRLHHHRSHDCRACLAARPDAPERAVATYRRMLRQLHQVRAWHAAVAAAGLVGLQITLAASDIAQVAVIVVLWAVLLGTCRFLNVHQRLAPWCPNCHEPDRASFTTFVQAEQPSAR